MLNTGTGDELGKLLYFTTSHQEVTSRLSMNVRYSARSRGELSVSIGKGVPLNPGTCMGHQKQKGYLGASSVGGLWKGHQTRHK